MNEELLQQHVRALKEKEREIQEQHDRLYAMVERKSPDALIKVEFRHTVERLSEKYQILLALLEVQKEEIPSEEYTVRGNALKEQYKEDVVTLAIALDEACGKTSEVA